MAEQKNLLYEIVNDLFGVEDITKKYTRETLKQYQFMLTRIVSIYRPTTASAFNSIGTDPKYTAYAYNRWLYNGGYPPKWCYTRGTKKAKEEKNKGKTITSKLIRDFCTWYNYDRKDVEFALKIKKEEMEKELIEFSNMQNQIKEK